MTTDDWMLNTNTYTRTSRTYKQYSIHPPLCVWARWNWDFMGSPLLYELKQRFSVFWYYLILVSLPLSPSLPLTVAWSEQYSPFQRKTTCTDNVTRICRSVWCEPTFCNLEWRNWEKSTDDKLYYCRYGYVIISQTNFGYRILLSTHHLYSFWDTNLSAIRHTNVVEMKFSSRECYATHRLAQIRWWMENRKLMTANCMRLK